MTPFAIAISVVLLSAPLPAQWLNLPTPGIPRTANGKPNLTAPRCHTTGRAAGSNSRTFSARVNVRDPSRFPGRRSLECRCRLAGAR